MKHCPYCAEEIQDAAIICRFCQRELVTGAVPARPPTIDRTWKPGVAAVLSLVIPGAGQMYKGEVGPGIAWLVGVVASYFFMLPLGLLLHLVCVVTAASGKVHPPGQFTLTPAPATPPRPPTPEELAKRAILARAQRRTNRIFLGVLAGIFVFLFGGVWLVEHLARPPDRSWTAPSIPAPAAPLARPPFTLLYREGATRFVLVTPEQAAHRAELRAIAEYLLQDAAVKDRIVVSYWTDAQYAPREAQVLDEKAKHQIAEAVIDAGAGRRDLVPLNGHRFVD